VAVRFRPTEAAGLGVLEPGVDVSEGVQEGELKALGDALYTSFTPGNRIGAILSPNTPGSGGRTFNLALSAQVSPAGTSALDGKIGDAGQLEELLHTSFPDLAAMLPKESYASLAKARPTGNRTVICSRFHAGRVVLIGDAAHGMLNNLGQGANAALEDCTVLIGALKGCDGTLEDALASFTETRQADTAAAAQLSKDTFKVPEALRTSPLLASQAWYVKILNFTLRLHQVCPPFQCQALSSATLSFCREPNPSHRRKH